MGASFEEINSTNSEGSSRSLKPCWGVACVKRMPWAAWVDILGISICMCELSRMSVWT